MRQSFLLLAAVAFLAPTLTRAQAPVAPVAGGTRSPWTVGARTGYSIPLGSGDASEKMSDLVSGQIPLQLEVNYRLQQAPQVTIGGYFSYGFGGVAGATKDLCDFYGQSCSSSSLRFGAQLAYDVAPLGAPTKPWVGVGLGYEQIKLKGAQDITIRGTEFLNFQAGHDWRVGATGEIGPFVSFALGQYSEMAVGGQSGTLADKKMHEWFTIGVRGTLGFAQ